MIFHPFYSSYGDVFLCWIKITQFLILSCTLLNHLSVIVVTIFTLYALLFVLFLSLKFTLNTITLLQPDDWHAHLRDGLALKRTVPDLAKQFARVICMPNLVPPVKTVDEAFTGLREKSVHHTLKHSHLSSKWECITEPEDRDLTAQLDACFALHDLPWVRHTAFAFMQSRK